MHCLKILSDAHNFRDQAGNSSVPPPKILENLEAYLYPQTFYLRKIKAE